MAILNSCHTLFDRDPAVFQNQMSRVFDEWGFGGLRDVPPEFAGEGWYTQFDGVGHHAKVMTEVLRREREYVYCCVHRNYGVEKALMTAKPNAWNIIKARETSPSGFVDEAKARTGVIALAWRAWFWPVIECVLKGIAADVQRFPYGVTYELTNPDIDKWYAFSTEGTGPNELDPQDAHLLTDMYPVSPCTLTTEQRLFAFKALIRSVLPRGSVVLDRTCFCYNDSGQTKFVGAAPHQAVVEIGAAVGPNRASRLLSASMATVSEGATMKCVYSGPARSQAYQFKEAVGSTEKAWVPALYEAHLAATGQARDQFAIACSPESNLMAQLALI